MLPDSNKMMTIGLLLLQYTFIKKTTTSVLDTFDNRHSINEGVTQMAALRYTHQFQHGHVDQWVRHKISY